MPASLELVVDLTQLRPHPLRDRDALEPEPARPGHRADVRETQEVERLRLAQTPRRPSPGGVPPELDQPRLVQAQLQPELRQPLVKLVQEPPRILLILEPDDEESRRGGIAPPAARRPVLQPLGLHRSQCPAARALAGAPLGRQPS